MAGSEVQACQLTWKSLNRVGRLRSFHTLMLFSVQDGDDRVGQSNERGKSLLEINCSGLFMGLLELNLPIARETGVKSVQKQRTRNDMKNKPERKKNA